MLVMVHQNVLILKKRNFDWMKHLFSVCLFDIFFCFSILTNDVEVKTPTDPEDEK